MHPEARHQRVHRGAARHARRTARRRMASQWCVASDLTTCPHGRTARHTCRTPCALPRNPRGVARGSPRAQAYRHTGVGTSNVGRGPAHARAIATGTRRRTRRRDVTAASIARRAIAAPPRADRRPSRARARSRAAGVAHRARTWRGARLRRGRRGAAPRPLDGVGITSRVIAARSAAPIAGRIAPRGDKPCLGTTRPPPLAQSRFTSERSASSFV